MPDLGLRSSVKTLSDPPALAGRVRLRQLLLMRTIADVGNLRGAAAALQMTQPAATRLLKEFEHRLGSVLFERSARGMTPTAEGRVVLARATRVLNDVDAIAEDLHHHRLGHGARTRIGVIASFAGVLLPRALARLKQDSPTTTVEIVEGAQDALIQALRNGSLDLVLGRALSESHAQDVQAELLFEERFAIVTGLSVAGRRRRFTLEQLVDEPWILPPRGVPVRVRIDSAFLAAAGRTPVDVIESASLFVNQQILHNERRFALMPDHAAAHFARRGLIARVACQLPEIFGPLTLFTLRDAAPLPAAVRLFDALRQVAREAAAGEMTPRSEG
jgi:DNA-binding transcriptional LysR family regulator